VLKPLTLEETEQLAAQVLKKHSGPLSTRKGYRSVHPRLPARYVVGAQIVAKERLHFDFAQHEDTFRNLLFAAFKHHRRRDRNKSEAETIKENPAAVGVVAADSPEDQALLQIIEQVESVPPHDTSRIIRLLPKRACCLNAARNSVSHPTC